MKLALALMGGAGWFGGLAHLRNLVRALALADPDASAEVLAVPAPAPLERSKLESVLGAPVRPVRDSAEFFGLLERGGFDAIFAPDRDFAGPGLPVPWLAFLHDFQHYRLPEHFTPEETNLRKRRFMRAGLLADLLLVSGGQALRDAGEFLPGAAGRARIVPPCAWPAPDIPDEDPDLARLRHGLPERYLLLPSQFWSHKNHATALSALAACRKSGVTLALTGCRDDDRNPDFRRELEERLAPLEREGAARVLGSIPYPDVLRLMRRAKAVVLPSLFEGYGIPVSEAAALGKPLILSDIPAHREHGAPGAEYFEPLDAFRLAALMLAAWETPGPSFDPEKERQGLSRAKRLAMEAGRALAGAVREAGTNRRCGRSPKPSPAALAGAGFGLDAAVDLATIEAAGGLDDSGRTLLGRLESEAGTARCARAAYARGAAQAGGVFLRRLARDGALPDAEEAYHAALDGLRWRAPEALPLLERVAGRETSGNALRAWAHFKLGQAAASGGLAGGPEEARRRFHAALAFDPGHAKARLALIGPGERLALDLCPDPLPGFVRVRFDPWDEDLWDYYLEGRLACALRLPALGLAVGGAPDEAADKETRARRLARLLMVRLKPGGSARLETDGPRTRVLLDQALRELGFSADPDANALVVTKPDSRKG